MANELLYGSGEASALFDAAQITEFFLVSIGDRDVSLLAHPAVGYYGDANGAGSSVATIPIVNLSDDQFSSVTEIQSGSNTDITTDTASITVARSYLGRNLSDMAGSLDVTGALAWMSIADGMLLGANLTVLSLLVAVGASFTTIAGSSGATLTHATIRSAKQSLRSAGVEGPFICILGQKQFNEWETDAQSLGGAVQLSAQAQEMSRLTGGSYQGTWDGIDFYVSAQVVTDGTDLNGCMFGVGAVGWRSLTTNPTPDQSIVADAGFVKVEAERAAQTAQTKLHGNMWVGVAKLQDSGGVRIRSVD